MRRLLATCLAVVTLQLIPAAVGHAQVLFRDDFDGPVIDAAKWVVEPGSGTLEFQGGRLRLSAACGGQFPWVVARSNPFPVAGDFSVRIGFRYVDVQQGGNGFSTTATGCDGYTCASGIAVWQDYCCGGLRATVGANSLPLSPPPNTQDHVFQWDLIGGVFYFSLDGTFLVASPAVSRPTGFWFGHPPYRYCPWTAQEIDFIEVALTGATPVTNQTWGRVKMLYR